MKAERIENVVADFTLDVSEVEDYRRKLAAVADAGALAFTGVAQRFRNLIIDEAQRIVPVRTGALQRSIGPEKSEASRLGYTAGIIAGEGYAGFVEFGTVNMSPRPYLRPALKRFRKPYIEALAREAKENLGVTKVISRRSLRGVARFGES